MNFFNRIYLHTNKFGRTGLIHVNVSLLYISQYGFRYKDDKILDPCTLGSGPLVSFYFFIIRICVNLYLFVQVELLCSIECSPLCSVHWLKNGTRYNETCLLHLCTSCIYYKVQNNLSNNSSSVYYKVQYNLYDNSLCIYYKVQYNLSNNSS